MRQRMPKITGLGGFFFKTSDKTATAKWFTEKLDLPTEAWGRVFPWRDHEHPERKGMTVMGVHSTTSDYFDPSPHGFMLNFITDDLDGMLSLLRSRGVEVLKVTDPDPYGRFAHVMGPDGIKIELWEPVKEDPSDP